MRQNGHPKVQHYVPQLILRGFTEGKNQINVFDKSTKNKFKTNIKKAAAESKFYDFEFDDIKGSIEQDLSKIETRITPIIKEIKDRKSISRLTSQQRRELSDFVALQFVRTPQYRCRWQQMGDIFKGWLQEKLVSEEQHAFGNIGDPDEAKLAHIQQIGEYKVFSEQFFEKPWILFRTTSKKPFWLSDNPIVLQNIRETKGRGNLGLGVDGIEIYFPISKSLCLSMMCPSNLSMIRELMAVKEKNPEFALKINRDWNVIVTLDQGFRSGEAVLTPQETVTNINSLQVINSSRFIFSSENQFSLAEEMLSDTPEYRDGPQIVSR
ncbi:MAG: DUF4238 domain-containing protein [Idiomarina sp.]